MANAICGGAIWYTEIKALSSQRLLLGLAVPEQMTNPNNDDKVLPILGPRREIILLEKLFHPLRLAVTTNSKKQVQIEVGRLCIAMLLH